MSPPAPCKVLAHVASLPSAFMSQAGPRPTIALRCGGASWWWSSFGLGPQGRAPLRVSAVLSHSSDVGSSGDRCAGRRTAAEDEHAESGTKSAAQRRHSSGGDSSPGSWRRPPRRQHQQQPRRRAQRAADRRRRGDRSPRSDGGADRLAQGASAATSAAWRGRTGPPPRRRAAAWTRARATRGAHATRGRARARQVTLHLGAWEPLGRCRGHSARTGCAQRVAASCLAAHRMACCR